MRPTAPPAYGHSPLGPLHPPLPPPVSAEPVDTGEVFVLEGLKPGAAHRHSPPPRRVPPSGGNPAFEALAAAQQQQQHHHTLQQPHVHEAPPGLGGAADAAALTAQLRAMCGIGGAHASHAEAGAPPLAHPTSFPPPPPPPSEAFHGCSHHHEHPPSWSHHPPPQSSLPMPALLAAPPHGHGPHGPAPPDGVHEANSQQLKLLLGIGGGGMGGAFGAINGGGGGGL